MPYLDIESFTLTGTYPKLVALCMFNHKNASPYRKFKQQKKYTIAPNPDAQWYSSLSPKEKMNYSKRMIIKTLGKRYILFFNHNKTPKNTIFTRQKKMRKGCWRMASVENSKYLASIETIKNGVLTVKIMDPLTPVESWKMLEVTSNQLSSTHITTAKTLDQLIINLKRTRILCSRVVEGALRTVDRRYFCSENPYHDCAINFGEVQYGACISSPHMHVWAAELLKDHLWTARDCLDVGSGSGYFTALMQVLAPQANVYGIECYSDLIAQSQAILRDHYPEIFKQIIFVEGDGEKGVLIAGIDLFQAIHVGFMCQEIPPALIAQLAPGGRMLIPIASGKSSSFDNRCIAGVYTCVDKDLDGTIKTIKLFSCSFVPSTSTGKGEAR